MYTLPELETVRIPMGKKKDDMLADMIITCYLSVLKY